MTPLLSSGRRQSNRANIRWHHSTQEVLPRRPHPHDRGHGRGEGHRHSRRERILSHGKSFVKISSATETVQHQIKHFMSITGYKFHEPLLFNVVVWGWLFQEQYCSVYKYNMSDSLVAFSVSLFQIFYCFLYRARPCVFNRPWSNWHCRPWSRRITRLSTLPSSWGRTSCKKLLSSPSSTKNCTR